MKTALLIDGTSDPVAIRLAEFDPSKGYILWGVPNQTPRQFKYFDRKEDLLIFRIVGDQLSDEEFLRQADAEADKFLNPARYAKMGRFDTAVA